MNFLELGERSSGTLRPCDLASAMLADLGKVGSTDLNLLTDVALVSESLIEGDKASEVLSEAMDELNNYVPDYCYYGMCPGDGASLGVWVDWTSLVLDADDGLVVKVSDMSEVGDGYVPHNVLHVNDHGNATFYVLGDNGEYTEVWAIV